MPDQEDPSSDAQEPSILDTGTTESPSDDEESSSPPQASETPSSTSEEEDSSAETDAPDVDALHFDDENLGQKLRHADEDQLDNASFGIIQVDDEGIVEFFNQYESELSGMDPDEVMGRNFFTQVAPCTNNRLFRGRFKKGVRRDELDETFTYTYTYKMRPTLVDVHMFRDEAGHNWITVQKY
jgi:photoactive yellow protein